ncbi:MAG: HEAT repeat domain-containing protein [bacterium]
MLIATFFLIVTVGLRPDTLWRGEKGYIYEGLKLINLSESDLEYDKHWINDSFRIQPVRDLMDKPLRVPDYVLTSGKKIKGAVRLSEYLRLCGEELTGRKIVLGKFKSKELIPLIKETYDLAKKHLELAFSGLTPEEKDSLIYTAPSLWADEADSLKRGYAGALHQEFGLARDTGTTLQTLDVLRLAAKVDLVQLHTSGAILLDGMETIARLARVLAQTEGLSWKEVAGVKGLVYDEFELPGGFKAVIGGTGSNTYQKDYAVIIDLGGDDIYEGRCAGAVGNFTSPVSFVIDLGGDDVYRNSEKLVNQGGGLFGVGVLWDLTGNDSYTAFHLSQGAGLFGIGVLIDEGGFDTYRAGYFAQGAGNFGSGVVLEQGGDDVYHAYSWAQALGGVWGYGLLYEREGDDLYYAGGKYPHLPLDPDQYRSFAQGFGFGWRDVASGGIGFLCDCNGNDKYIAEVYGQGTSYWFALGMLLDEEGNDLYSAAQYSQGAGIHLSVGALLDLEGDDHYFSRFGPAQGEGHDVGVGWLLDKDGDDVYYASGGQGIGLTNSVGVFVDSRGNDDYASREGLSEGGANWTRGTGGIGLFIDLQGDDRYAERDKGENNHIWTSGTYALGMDLEAIEPRKEPWEDTVTTFPELDTMTNDSLKLARLFSYASRWEVRADIPRVKTARKILVNEFKERAVEYIFHNELRTFDGLKLRAIEEVFKAFKDTAAHYLYQGLHSENDTVARNSVYLLGELDYTPARETLRLMLKNKPDDKVAGVLVYALGKLHDTLSIPIFTEYRNHPKERMRLRVAEALQNIKDTLGLPILLGQLGDPCYLVKVAAVAGISELGSKAMELLKLEFKKAKSDEQRAILIKTMKKTVEKMDKSARTPELKKGLTELVQAYLASDNPALRRETEDFIQLLEGRGSLPPERLFLLPREPVLEKD